MNEIYAAHRRDTGEQVEFPVDWRTAEDARLVWRWNPDHNAFPLTPLSADFSRREGTGGASARFMGGNSMTIHGFRYSARSQGGGGRRARAEEDWADLVPRIDEVWERGWREQIEREAMAIATADYEKLSLTDLVERMEALPATVAVHSDLMFRALDIVSYARDQLDRFLRDVLGSEADVDALILELIEGYANASLQANARLWDIAQMAAHSPELRDFVESADGQSHLGQLEALAGGQEMAEALRRWLDRDGRRSGDYGELSMPALREDLPTVLNLLRAYLDREDPREAMQRAAARREATVERLKRTMSEDEILRFDLLLGDAAHYIPVKESRNGVMCISRDSLRAPALAAGRKLVEAGVLAEVGDVFFLGFAEIAGTNSEDAAHIRKLVKERRDAYEYWRNIVPPATIGAVTNEAGDGAVEGIIRGVGASKGIAHGTARVITTLDDGYRLQPGEVLVTRTTTSAWTPLFLAAGAIVTDASGMLSHCAVVAREYQLPAVVGTYKATHMIRDGASVTVDGTTGIVTIDTD